jgi:hypothetical protein
LESIPGDVSQETRRLNWLVQQDVVQDSFLERSQRDGAVLEPGFKSQLVSEELNFKYKCKVKAVKVVVRKANKSNLQSKSIKSHRYDVATIFLQYQPLYMEEA